MQTQLLRMPMYLDHASTDPVDVNIASENANIASLDHNTASGDANAASWVAKWTMEGVGWSFLHHVFNTKYAQDFGGQFNNKNLSNMCRILVAISASLCLPLVSKLRKIILHRISSINSYLYNYGPQRIL